MQIREKIWWYLGLLIGFLIITTIVTFFLDKLTLIKFEHIPLHSTIETIGGMTAILVSLILFHHNHYENDGLSFFIATGFCCMGILDTFHALCYPGGAFIFLHSVASVVGGFFFMLSWLPKSTSIQFAKEQRWIAGAALLLTFSVAIRAVIFPEAVPNIIHLYDNEFTQTTIILNTIASLFFLTSIPKLLMIFNTDGKLRYFLFICLALLFGCAEMIFQFSDIWDGVWWAWHFLRLLAYLLTLFFVVKSYLQISNKLRHE